MACAYRIDRILNIKILRNKSLDKQLFFMIDSPSSNLILMKGNKVYMDYRYLRACLYASTAVFGGAYFLVGVRL